MTFFFVFIIIGIAFILVLSGRNFQSEESRIMNLYSSVLSDMNIDLHDSEIHASNISDISKSIQNLTHEIEDVARHITKESSENQKWLIGIINEFNTHLRMWIDRHTDELESIESMIKNQETEKPSEKSVLELAYTRLENHRIQIEKI